MDTQLYFWKPLMEIYRKELSLVEDYYNRTKKQFDDIEKEAEDYANSLYNNYPGNEDADPASIAELAQGKGLELFEVLSIMKSSHLLMTILMLYYIWEQQLKKFTTSELKHYIDFSNKILEYCDIKKIFKLHKVDIEKTKSWAKIKELKLLANTIKHGEGHSAKELRKIRPDFFKNKLLSGIDTLEFAEAVLLDENSLQVKESDLNVYIKATKSFWDEMPERAYSDVNTIVNELNKVKKRI